MFSLYGDTTINISRPSGVLFICFAVDYRLLWETLTDDIVEDGFQFYRTFYNSPKAIKVRPLHGKGRDCWDLQSHEALLHGMVGTGLLGLVSKLHKWDESAMFFDGSSIGEKLDMHGQDHPR